MNYGLSEDEQIEREERESARSTMLEDEHELRRLEREQHAWHGVEFALDEVGVTTVLRWIADWVDRPVDSPAEADSEPF